MIKGDQFVRVSKTGCIVANGGNVNCNTHDVPGCGSGGRVHLIAPKIENRGSITAIGGYNICDDKNSAGCGGNGRIRFDCKKENTKLFQSLFGYIGNIQPKIGCLHFV